MRVHLIICIIYMFCIEMTASENDTDTEIISRCGRAKSIYLLAGYQEDDLYDSEEIGSNLKVCRKNVTCCKPPAEINLLNLSEKKRAGLTSQVLEDLKQKYGDSGMKFKGLCRKMIHVSFKHLDAMFKKTYKERYLDNLHVFKSLYQSLHQYFNGSELDLKGSVDTFFEKLFQKIYVMLQPWSVFDKKYENCIFESTNYAKPFGDIQRKVAHQISRSFLASRVFLLGLKEGMEVATKLLQFPVRDECSRAFMKMSQCSVCSGVPETIKPCKSYCINVMKGCYVDTIIVQPMWNQFIDAMISLAVKIEGPFSIEAVVESLGVKISEAIMAFQDNQRNITDKVEDRCGVPSVLDDIGSDARKRRASPMTEPEKDDPEKLKGLKSVQRIIGGWKVGLPSSSLPFLNRFDVNNQKEPTEFEKMLHDMKSSLSELKDYWILLSQKWCSNGTSTVDTDCWNGANSSGYHLNVVKDFVDDLYNNNPEVKLVKQKNILILDQVSILERNIKLIKSALLGNTEQCIDCEGGSGEGSGEESVGSGGSGVDPTDTTASGVEETVKPTESNCANSVLDNCFETIIPKTDIDNNIPYVPVNEDVAYSARDPQNSSMVETANFILLLFSIFVAYIL